MQDQGFPQQGKRFEPKNMLFRYLGDTGLKVSVLGLGGWLTSGSDQGVSEVKQTAECLQEAWNYGINFFDTAEVYAEASPRLSWARLSSNATLSVVTTSLPPSFILETNGFPNNHVLSRKHIIEGMKRSLKRLDLDSVDVAYAHRADFCSNGGGTRVVAT